MKTTHITPNGTEVSDTDVFAIRLFIFSETNGECSLPINSILKLVDIFEILNNKESA